MKNLRKHWRILLGVAVVLAIVVLIVGKFIKLPVTNPPPGKIAFVSRQYGRSVIYTMESDGSDQMPLTEDLDTTTSPVWSPDGRHIAFAGVEDDKQGLWVMDADGSNKVHLFNSQYGTYPRWSSDSIHILFQHTLVGSLEVGQYNNLYVINRGGSNLVHLTESLEAGGENAAWSPNDTHIAFRSEQDGNWDIYVIDRDGLNLVNLSDHPADEEGFVWSPDSTRIAFGSEQDGNWEGYVVNRDGSNMVNLTNHPAYDGTPVWSPDGTRIAFLSDRSGPGGEEGGLYIMNDDGTDVKRVGPGGRQLLWSLDGDRIMYKCNEGALCTTGAEGASQTRLAPPKRGRRLFRVSWSPNGNHVTFVEIGSFPPQTDVTAPWTYFSVASMSTSHLVRLGRGSREDSWLHSWSPEGQYLVFAKGDIETMEIFIASADGRHQSQLTHNSHRNWLPAWQPQAP